MSASMEAFLTVMDVHGKEAVVLSMKQRWQVLKDWRHVYASGLQCRTGKWRIQEFEWHVFSSGHARAEQGTSALESYRQERPVIDFHVIPEAENLPAYRCRAGELPDFTGHFLDVLVFPEDLSWTMAFTHETSTDLEMGPFFSRREWVEGDAQTEVR